MDFHQIPHRYQLDILKKMNFPDMVNLLKSGKYAKTLIEGPLWNRFKELNNRVNLHKRKRYTKIHRLSQYFDLERIIINSELSQLQKEIDQLPDDVSNREQLDQLLKCRTELWDVLAARRNTFKDRAEMCSLLEEKEIK